MSEEIKKEVVAPAGKASAVGLMEIIKKTPLQDILALELVKKRYIDNYNLCNPGNMGEIMYQRNMIFLRQRISEDEHLKKADPFSMYKVIINLGVNGDSIDPQDKQVYVYARGGKAVIERQAPSFIRKLMDRKLIISAASPKLVYDGDEYCVENGKVIVHKEYRKTSKIIAGYIKFIVDANGTEKHINYWPEDWNDWRKKSPQPNGANWKSDNDQPLAAFLKTKIVKHACQDPSWPSGNAAPVAETYNDVVVDADDSDYQVETTAKDETAKPADNITKTTSVNIPNQNTNLNNAEIIQEVNAEDENFTDGKKEKGVKIEDAEEDFS